MDLFCKTVLLFKNYTSHNKIRSRPPPGGPRPPASSSSAAGPRPRPLPRPATTAVEGRRARHSRRQRQTGTRTSPGAPTSLRHRAAFDSRRASRPPDPVDEREPHNAWRSARSIYIDLLRKNKEQPAKTFVRERSRHATTSSSTEEPSEG